MFVRLPERTWGAPPELPEATIASLLGEGRCCLMSWKRARGTWHVMYQRLNFLFLLSSRAAKQPANRLALLRDPFGSFDQAQRPLGKVGAACASGF